MYIAEIDLHHGATTQTLHDPYSRDAVLANGNVTEVLNAINDFQFELLPTHPLFDADIRPYISLVRIRDKENKIIFRGRIVDVTRNMSSSGEITKAYVVECELAYLLDSMQEAEELVNVSVAEYFKRILSVHNGRVEDKKRIDDICIHGIKESVPVSFDRDCFCATTTDVYHINYASTFQNIRAHILEALGGYVWLEYGLEQGEERRVLHYERESGTLQEMPIELAINLENMTSSYQASQDFTRLIPLGAELERYELAINRLREVGLLNDDEDILNTQFWLDEVKYWRDGAGSQHLEGEEGEGLSPWSGQLLLALSKLNYKHRCVCLEECQSDSCSICNVKRMMEAIENEEMPADINSRYYYNEAVDYLCNSGLIGSSEHWKEEDKASNIHVRWLIRLAALTVSPESPRRGNHNSIDSALHWFGGDSGWFNWFDWEEWLRPSPPPPPSCGCEECECCDCCDCEPCECCDCCDCEPCDCCDCEEEECCPNCCDCCDCEPCDCFEYCECVCVCICDCDLCEDCAAALIQEPLPTNQLKQQPLLARDVDLSHLSPWMGQLMITISKLNLSRFRGEEGEATIAGYREEIQETLDDEEAYYQAIDSLSNAGVIHSPNYWKQEELSEDEDLRMLIRLSDKMCDPEYPLMMSPEDAIAWLKDEHGFFTADEEAFWIEQIQAPPEGTPEEDDHRLSEWIPELLIKLSLVNYDRSIEGLRELLAPKPISPIDDFGAYNEALDSLSNAGAIQSPDYWKEPKRRNETNLRWLIRLADLTIDHDDPQSDFPRPRLTIKENDNDPDWLPIIEGPHVPIVEGVVIFDTNDPKELREKALRWIEENQTITNSVSISALDLSHLDHFNYDNFKVGDSYEVVNPLLGINGEKYPLIERKIDIVNPLKSDLTFGGRQITMSASVSKSALKDSQSNI